MLGLKQALEKDIAMQEKLIARDEQQVLLFPEGRLKLSNSGNSILLLDKNNKYKAVAIDSDVVVAIKKKRFFSERLTIMKSNLTYEKKLLSQYIPYDMYSINNQLPKAYLFDFERITSYVKAENDSSNSFHGESLKHRTVNGEYRRSKSELLISMLYDEYGIPYEYETTLSWPKGHMSNKAETLKATLELPNFIRPDFRLTEPSGRKIYHEHFGLLDNPEYLQSVTKKILFYHLNGYTLGDNLIVTADNIDGTFNQARIVELIETRLTNKNR